jgi:hypothetical protein
MSDDLASYTRRALSEMRAMLVRPGGQASALEERVSVPAWDARLGRVLTQCIGAGFRYGPAAVRWRSGALVVGANWSERRRPDKAIERKLGSEPSAWPSPAAACSPFVGIVLRLAYDLRGSEWGDVGKSIGKALKRRGLVEHAVDAHPKRHRAWDWDNLPLVLPAPLCVVLYRSHVVLLADCDRLPVTRGGERLRGLWVIGADGSFADDKGERGWATRRYSCQPLTVEPVAERAKRQRNRPDKTRRFALVGLAAPDPLPAQAPRLLVEAA